MKFDRILLLLSGAAALFVAATTKVPAQGAPPDPAIMQGSIAALQNQRNAALDTAASYEAMIRVLQSKLAASEARVKDLETKLLPQGVPQEDPAKPNPAETDQKKAPPG